jgi:hypothetical protein
MNQVEEKCEFSRNTVTGIISIVTNCMQKEQQELINDYPMLGWILFVFYSWIIYLIIYKLGH